MIDMELIDGKLYWIKYKNSVYLSKYQEDRGIRWFDLFGTDEGFSLWKIDVLGEANVVIPDYVPEDWT